MTTTNRQTNRHTNKQKQTNKKHRLKKWFVPCSFVHTNSVVIAQKSLGQEIQPAFGQYTGQVEIFDFFLTPTEFNEKSIFFYVPRNMIDQSTTAVILQAP